MTDHEVGSLAEELQLLALTIGTQDPEAPDSIVGMLRELLEGAARPTQEPVDVQRIDLS